MFAGFRPEFSCVGNLPCHRCLSPMILCLEYGFGPDPAATAAVLKRRSLKECTVEFCIRSRSRKQFWVDRVGWGSGNSADLISGGVWRLVGSASMEHVG